MNTLSELCSVVLRKFLYILRNSNGQLNDGLKRCRANHLTRLTFNPYRFSSIGAARNISDRIEIGAARITGAVWDFNWICFEINQLPVTIMNMKMCTLT